MRLEAANSKAASIFVISVLPMKVPYWNAGRPVRISTARSRCLAETVTDGEADPRFRRLGDHDDVRPARVCIAEQCVEISRLGTREDFDLEPAFPKLRDAAIDIVALRHDDLRARGVVGFELAR